MDAKDGKDLIRAPETLNVKKKKKKKHSKSVVKKSDESKSSRKKTNMWGRSSVPPSDTLLEICDTTSFELELVEARQRHVLEVRE